jgi:hypothetical protein
LSVNKEEFKKQQQLESVDTAGLTSQLEEKRKLLEGAFKHKDEESIELFLDEIININAELHGAKVGAVVLAKPIVWWRNSTDSLVMW